MAYEHQKAVNQESNRLVEILSKAMDGVDPQEILPLVASLQASVLGISAVLQEEDKNEFKAKFLVKLLAASLSKSLDVVLPDEES